MSDTIEELFRVNEELFRVNTELYQAYEEAKDQVDDQHEGIEAVSTESKPSWSIGANGSGRSQGRITSETMRSPS